MHKLPNPHIPSSNNNYFDEHVKELEKLYPGVPSIGCIGMCYDTGVVEEGVGVAAFTDGVRVSADAHRRSRRPAESHYALIRY